MQYVVVTRSPGGWGVSLENAVLCELPDVLSARDRASDLARSYLHKGEPTSVVDLTETDAPGALFVGPE